MRFAKRRARCTSQRSDGNDEYNMVQTYKSAHTALAVKACLLGGNSNTKCSMTFVNIAVAISALAGGAKNGFAPRPEYGGVFDIFRGFLGV